MPQCRSPTEERREVVVDPRISSQVKDVRLRVGRVPLTKRLGHLPGKSGVWAGIGNLIGWVREGNAHLLRQANQYGPVYRHVFGIDPAVCVTEPALVARIARNEDRVWSSALAWGYYLSQLDPERSSWDGILTLDFEPHREIRALLKPAFTAEAIAGYVAVTAEMCTRATEAWIRRGHVSFKAEVRRLLADVSARVFMGVDDPDESALLARAVEDLWLATFMASWRWNPMRGRAVRGYRQLRARLAPRMAQRRTQGGSDLFSHFCRAGKQLSWADDAALVQTFVSLMLGAFDTTALALASMAHLLAHHSSWQNQVRDEALALGQKLQPRTDFSRMSRTDWVWNETLRLFPVASHLMRRNLLDVDLGGHHIPAGTLVFVLLGPAMQDPRWWSAPETFDPERFSPARAEDRHCRDAFLPFGAGAHACIGAHLAGQQAKALWHSLLTRARLDPIGEGGMRHAYRPFGSVAGPVELRVRPL